MNWPFSQLDMESGISRTYRNPRNGNNVYHVGGIPVEFPYQPYGSQLAFMARVISTLDRAQRDGHCHALLESPTGTGKSLSLLCSTLAWQQNQRSKHINANLSRSKPAPRAMCDTLTSGGGFIPEVEPCTRNTIKPVLSTRKSAPTIFYASRTHSQITQVIREYRKTAYRVPMAVLASRKHYCTNAYLKGRENIDEECKVLLKNQELGCSQFKNAHKVKGHPSIQKGGCHEVHDIEDLVKVGQVVNGCAYFAARSLADNAQLVFCPYSYIINPIIRRAMEVDIRNDIVILDEAHNIEDMARDAGSLHVEEDVLYKLQMELEQLCYADALVYQPLYEMIEGILSWIDRRKSTLGKHEFQHYFSCWSGDKALRELQEANISNQCFPILQECATKAIKAASDVEAGAAHLSGVSVATLEGLFSSLSYFFSENGLHMVDYQLGLQRCVKKVAGQATHGWTHTLSLWCLNPAVVFRDIADLSMSVILTSGTLSPMNSFSSELGVQFGTSLEAPHVIDIESQLWAAVIPTGPGNYPLNASYKTADAYAFQDALGTTLEEICKIVPGGSLVFFPSYKLMEKLCRRWHETGQWSRLNTRKSLFVEPRGGNQDDFELVLKAYYEKNLDKYHGHAMEPSRDTKKKGAAFLAVSRGKVSEGIDFSDDNARVVIIVGIPFPNINDIQVTQKKKYNDMYKTSKKLLSGNEWYCQQAFRALNQAAGRCIRHRFDYGAIILLDERFQEERNILSISKWLRKAIRQYDSLDMALEDLKSFFRDVKERVDMQIVDVLQDSEVIEGIPSKYPIKRLTEDKNLKIYKPCHDVRKVVSTCLMMAKSTARLSESNPAAGSGVTYPQLKAQRNSEVQASYLTDEKHNTCCSELVDLESSFGTDSRSVSIGPSHDNSETSIVNETAAETSIVDETAATSGSCSITAKSFSKEYNSFSSTIETSKEFPEAEQLLLHPSVWLTNCSEALSCSNCPLVATPRKDVIPHVNGPTPETGSSLCLSSNSYLHKRRKLPNSLLVSVVESEQMNALDTKTSDAICSVRNKTITCDHQSLVPLSTQPEYGGVAVLNSLDTSSYLPKHQTSGGRRTTKSKLKLPKKGLLFSSGDPS